MFGVEEIVSSRKLRRVRSLLQQIGAQMSARAALLSAATLLGVLLGSTSALAQPVSALPPAIQATDLSSSPALLQFVPTGIHYGDNPRERVTFTNESSSAVSVMSVGVTGVDSNSFQIVYDGCANQMVWPGNSCTVEVQFQPNQLGELSATLALELTAGEGSVEVPLTGIGASGTLTADPGTLSYAGIPYTQGGHEENQSETEQVNVESLEYGTQIESVSITGPDASSFSLQYNDCENSQLASNNSCDAGIRFQPLSPGAKHAELVIASDSSSSPLVVPLEGEGLLGPKVSVESNEAQLGAVALGASATHTFTVTNGGDYPLYIQQSFVVSGTPQMFPLLSNTCDAQIVAPSSSCEFTVSFQPTAPGEKDASIVFVTNATPQINVLGIDGVGVQKTLAQATPTSSPTPPISPASAPKILSGTAPHLLMFEESSRLLGSFGKETLNAGIEAQCPIGVGVCRTESFLVEHLPASAPNASSQGFAQRRVLLGSQTTRLLGGEHATVRIPLSRKAVALLEQNGHLRATIDIVIHAGGQIIAERARAVTLIA